MIAKPKPAHALLPGFLLAACAALPGGAAAQSATPAKGMSAKGTGTLSAAMAEVLRSPFHATNGAAGLAIVQRPGVPFHTAETGQVRDSARGPSFHRVFWPTLGAAYLSLGAGLLLLLGANEEDSTALRVMSVAVPVLVPATAARIAGGSFGKGVLGSALGAGLGVATFFLGLAIGLDDSVAWWAMPPTHAFVTTALSRLRARTP